MAQRFFVLDPSGNRYGPAELPLLDQWAKQGRIAPQTVLQDETSGQTFYAQDFPPLAMNFSQMNTPMGMPSQTMSSPYSVVGRRGPRPGDPEYYLSFVCSLSAFVLSGIGPWLALGGVGLAFLAARKGHPSPGVAVVVSIICLVLVGLPHFGLGPGL